MLGFTQSNPTHVSQPYHILRKPEPHHYAGGTGSTGGTGITGGTGEGCAHLTLKPLIIWIEAHDVWQ